MTDPIKLYGFPVSPHVRAARIAFHEAGVPITFEEIALDHLATAAYGKINPFHKMPALTHGAVTLYETPALLSYANGLSTKGPASGGGLEPSDPAARARMWQFVGVAQHYLYPVGIMQLYFQNVLTGLFGMDRDEAIADGAVAPTTRHLDVLEEALAGGPQPGGFLAGGALSLADLYCGAMVDYIARTKDGRTLVAARPHVQNWLGALRERDSFKTTFAAMLQDTDQT